MKPDDTTQDWHQAFVQLRRDLHAHPELAFAEHRTADLVANRLASWGWEVHRGLGGTGVVGTLRSVEGNQDNALPANSTVSPDLPTRRADDPNLALPRRHRAIGLRADMDALPLQERNEFAHRSRHEGVMHACGHDGHTAILLATCERLSVQLQRSVASGSPPPFSGTVHAIFQPAEEGGGGARRMIEEGLFERFPCDVVFALHNWPGMPTGRLGIRPGPMMASSNEFEIELRGRGCHAAMPHLGTDAVMAAVNLAQSLQTIVSRNVKPVEAAVLSVTQIHAGGPASNILPSDSRLGGTVRTFTLETLDLVERRLREITAGVAAAHGVDAIVRFQRNYPPTVNDPRAAALLAEAMGEIAGAQAVDSTVEPTMGAEDFAYMLQATPGAYAFLGNGEGTHREAGHGLGPCTLHNASYDFNDDLIPIGAKLWCKIVERFLN